MIAAGINTHAPIKMLYSSVLVGIGAAVVFSVAILGATRSPECAASTAPAPPRRTPRLRPPAC